MDNFFNIITTWPTGEAHAGFYDAVRLLYPSLGVKQTDAMVEFDWVVMDD
jgi:hypothetical protein